MAEISHSRIAAAGLPVACAAVVAFIGWAPAPVGFVIAAAMAAGWCRWAEGHPAG